MGSLPYQNVFRPEEMQHSIGVSPAVIDFVENKAMRKVVSVERCLDADGFRFVFEDGDFFIIASTYIEHIERESDTYRLISQHEFEDMVVRGCFSGDEPTPKLGPRNHPSTMRGRHRAIQEEKFEETIEDELDKGYESVIKRFYNNLRKVYWYRHSKK